jgi:hypothetical protein
MINGEVRANHEMVLESVQGGVVLELLELQEMIG